MNKTAERALLARPLALGLGALGVVWLNPALHGDWIYFLALALVFGGPSLVLWTARRRPSIARFADLASAGLTLPGWGVLATFSLGLKSPILAAFFFEIGLAALSMRPVAVLGVTGGAIAVLVLVQSLFGLSTGWPLLAMESGFLVVVGGLGHSMAQRRAVAEAALRIQSEELGSRLESLQRQLDDERVVARVGENVARVAHGLKNAVHSLRGFVGLIERAIEPRGASREALDGLRTVIDDLERLARMTLAEGAASVSASKGGAASAGDSASAGRARSATPGAKSAAVLRTGLAPVAEAAVRDLQPANPEVVFALRVAPDARTLCVPLAAAPLHELLTILLRNAAEAMHGAGRCTLEIVRRDERAHLEIGDEGDGLAPEAAERLFTPGYTTKTGGSGFGLFLARRIVEDHGGTLALVSKPHKGATAILDLPAVDAAESRSAGSDPDEKEERA